MSNSTATKLSGFPENVKSDGDEVLKLVVRGAAAQIKNSGGPPP
jgi:hypothetical protein